VNAPPSRRAAYCVGVLREVRRAGQRRAPRVAHAVRRRRSLSRILVSRPIDESSSHSSGPPVARGFERPTRGNGRAIRDRPKPVLPPTRSCSGWGLPSPVLTSRAGELLPSPFHPYRSPFDERRSAFCGTFPRLLGAAVNGHPALRSPDFPPVAKRRAAARPPPTHDARRVMIFAKSCLDSFECTHL